MPNRVFHFRLCRNAIAIVVLSAVLAVNGRAEERMSKEEFFEKRVRPLLAANCYECYSAHSGKSKGGLLLDSRAGWIKGGQSGPVITPGSPHLSLLLKAVSHTDPKLQMPPDAKLPEAERNALMRWIADGAFDPREAGIGREKGEGII